MSTAVIRIRENHNGYFWIEVRKANTNNWIPLKHFANSDSGNIRYYDTYQEARIVVDRLLNRKQELDGTGWVRTVFEA